MKHLVIEHRGEVLCIFSLKKVKELNYRCENGVWYMVVKVGKAEHKFENHNNFTNNFKIKII